jgi:hypothetical protein
MDSMGSIPGEDEGYPSTEAPRLRAEPPTEALKDSRKENG